MIQNKHPEDEARRTEVNIAELPGLLERLKARIAL